MEVDNKSGAWPDQSRRERTPGGNSQSKLETADRLFSRRAFLSGGSAFLALRSAKVRAAVQATLPPALQPPTCVATSSPFYPPVLEKFVAKLDPDADDFLCERYVLEIERVLGAWTSSLCNSDGSVGGLQSNVAENIVSCSLSSPARASLRSAGPLHTYRLSFREAETKGREAFLKDWTSYLSTLASIETVELQVCGIRTVGDSPLRVDTDISFDIVGNAHDSSREQRVGTWHLSWTQDSGAQQDKARWTVYRWSADPEMRSCLNGAGFADVTGHCLRADSPGMAQLLAGIDYWRTGLDGASGIDVFGNHGIAVGDIDDSGFDSFYVCQPSGLPNRLYRNRRDGTFEDITDISGTGILDGTASALFADFQNRGRQDLLVVRSAGPLLFTNMGSGRFELRPNAFVFARPPQGTFTSVAVADYDRDGFLDIYFCLYNYYKGLDHHQYPSPYYDAQNGPPNYLFRNCGDGTFKDVTTDSGMDQNNNRFSFAAEWCDYDNDGWPDLYVANDFGRKNLYRNHGDGTFSDIAAKAGVEDYGPGMSTCWFDADNDGKQDLYVANMWLAEGRRITADPHFLHGIDPTVRALYRKHNAGNSLYQNVGTERFEDRSAEAGTAQGGWSWSCAAWDFDNDGWNDLYVANGFVSGPDRYDLQSFFWRQVAQRSLTPAGSAPDYELAWNAINELLRSDYSWSGYQRNAFFLNNRDGTFSSVAGVLGLDLIDDCRAYALSDFDHDGRLEFVLKNRTGPQIKLIRNNLENIGNSIAFRLRGHTSNRDAIGASVTIETGAQRQTKFISAGSGFASQHTKELFFGLGEMSGPVSISVRWPTGMIDLYENLPANHHIEIDESVRAFTAKAYLPGPAYAHKPSEPLASPKLASTVLTWLIAPLIGPALRVSGLSGETQQLSAYLGRPTLLTFIRADCDQSNKQLEQLQLHISALSKVGLELFTVAVLEDEDSLNGSATIDSLIKHSKITFPVYIADPHAAGAWNIQYRYLFDRRRDMPLPVSFLLNKDGAIVRVYQGIVEPPMVIQDENSAPATPADWCSRALPFSGPYYGPTMTHDYLTFGIAFTQAGYVDEAQAAFQRAIDANPSLQVAWFNLGTIYLNKKMYVEARKCLNEAVRLNPQDSDAWNNLGTISGMEEHYDEALDEFRRSALVNPHHENAVENMMRIYQFQSRAADAQKTLEQLIGKAPEAAELHLALSTTLLAQNNLLGARAELETSIRLNPGNPDAINNLGAVLLRMGLLQEALEQFETCRRMAPDFNRAVINTSVIYKRTGKQEKARQLLEEFLSRHPGDVSVRTALTKMGSQ